jgi:hypothetical protein
VQLEFNGSGVTTKKRSNMQRPEITDIKSLVIRKNDVASAYSVIDDSWATILALTIIALKAKNFVQYVE